jgi:mono/diheme cytochrome c family protein
LRTVRMAGAAMFLVLVGAGCGSNSVPAGPSTAPLQTTQPQPQPGSDLKNPTGMDASSIQKGSDLYDGADCVVCHGKAGDGKGFDAKNGHMNVHDWRNVVYNKSFTDGQLYEIMAMGKDRMPGYAAHNTPTEIWLMIDYIRSLAVQ